MAATVLNSTSAIEVAVFVVRAFVRLRQTLAGHSDLAKKLDELERKTVAIVSEQDSFAAETRAQFKQVIDALRQLMSTAPSSRRPIGFIIPK
jgi:GTPase Era involved in 16S rRNA processing